MKKNKLYILIICSILAMAASCARTAEPYESPEENWTIQDAEFKITLSDESTGAVTWSEGDDLSVFSLTATNPANHKFTQVQGSLSSFTGSVETGTTSIVALYPYNSSASIENGVITSSIPSTQTATAGSFCTKSTLCITTAGKTPGVPGVSQVAFSQLCAVLRFTVPSNITYANKITVTSKSGAVMAGTVTIDSSTKAITSKSGSSSIVLSGDFVGGNNYYVAVAPGTYTNGFTFKIETEGGVSFTRETTKTAEAVAGKIYALGTLSLVLAESDVTSSVTITHNVSGGVLSGSTAKINLSTASEFASTVKSWTVVLKNGSTVYRTLTFSGNASAKEMTMVNNWDYIPKGNYTYEISYVVNNGSKDVTRSFAARNTTSPQLSGVTIGVNLTGYSSYDTYKSSGATAANALDGSTIYNIGASYKSGLNLKDMSKYASLLSSSSTLDGTAKTGDATGQSWAAHTIKGTVSFDGVSGTATKTVNVTGLPYNKSCANFASIKSDWTVSNTEKVKWYDTYQTLYGSTNTDSFKGFYAPATINVSVNYRFKTYSSTKWTYPHIYFYVGPNTLVDQEGNHSTASFKEIKNTAHATTLTSSSASMQIKVTGGSITDGGAHIQVFLVAVSYR